MLFRSGALRGAGYALGWGKSRINALCLWPGADAWAAQLQVGDSLQAELHEAGEFFELGGHRPFFPNHQDEGSPYERVERWESTPWH